MSLLLIEAGNMKIVTIGGSSPELTILRYNDDEINYQLGVAHSKGHP